MTASKLFAFALLAAFITLIKGLALEKTSDEAHLAKRYFRDCLKDMFTNVNNTKPANADAAVCFSGHYEVTFTDKFNFQFEGTHDCFDKPALISHRNRYDCFYFMNVNSVTFKSVMDVENLASWSNDRLCTLDQETYSLSCFAS
ncbi:uncharacterized protein SPSC_01238 [Sporisorium scitamineum]|uniref:DUF7888 domain-containing protein n=1 Tax=Sporisorium scitamineum TaxID=49012 RepID=A0A127Z910_9BASI|nr:uncharacterized protein SPSC_01238 [Sporisorium scitamineum]